MMPLELITLDTKKLLYLKSGSNRVNNQNVVLDLIVIIFYCNIINTFNTESIKSNYQLHRK